MLKLRSSRKTEKILGFCRKWNCWMARKWLHEVWRVGFFIISVWAIQLFQQRVWAARACLFPMAPSGSMLQAIDITIDLTRGKGEAFDTPLNTHVFEKEANAIKIVSYHLYLLSKLYILVYSSLKHSAHFPCRIFHKNKATLIIFLIAFWTIQFLNEYFLFFSCFNSSYLTFNLQLLAGIPQKYFNIMERPTMNNFP